MDWDILGILHWHGPSQVGNIGFDLSVAGFFALNVDKIISCPKISVDKALGVHIRNSTHDIAGDLQAFFESEPPRLSILEDVEERSWSDDSGDDRRQWFIAFGILMSHKSLCFENIGNAFEFSHGIHFTFTGSFGNSSGHYLWIHSIVENGFRYHFHPADANGFDALRSKVDEEAFRCLVVLQLSAKMFASPKCLPFMNVFVDRCFGKESDWEDGTQRKPCLFMKGEDVLRGEDGAEKWGLRKFERQHLKIA